MKVFLIILLRILSTRQRELNKKEKETAKEKPLIGIDDEANELSKLTSPKGTSDEIEKTET